jgi:hypothetical protein
VEVSIVSTFFGFMELLWIGWFSASLKVERKRARGTGMAAVSAAREV